MFRHFIALTLLALGTPAFAAGPASPRILTVEPTVFFANDEPLRQIAWVQFENSETAVLSVEVNVTAEGATQPGQRFELPPGTSRQDVLIPDLAHETVVQFEVSSAAGAVIRFERPWKPQRKWKVFVVKSSHEDIGYENYLWVKQKEIADFIDLGRHFSAKTPIPAEEGARVPGGYRYWLETMLFPRYYEAERGEVALRDLIETSVKPGNTPLAGAPSGIHAHWMDYEELARATYPGRRDYRDRFGLDVDTYAIVDNPSISWAEAQVLADAGYKYAVRFGQPFRTGGNNSYATTGVPAIFWWEGPDTMSRVLFTWRHHYGINFWFGQTGGGGYADLSDLASTNVQRELAAVQDDGELGPYPWDALLIPSYQDHEVPAWDNRALRRWQGRYRYPEIRIADPRDFMAYMEQNFGAEIPVLRGDLNNFSADYATIDPESQAWTRTASRLLPLAEGLAAVAGTIDPSFVLSPGATSHAYQRLFDYSEHSWPTSPPPGPVHQFNAQWGKRLEGRRALADATALFERSFAALTDQILTGAAPTWVVFNPLAHARTDLVISTDRIPALIDPVTRAPVPMQRLSTGETVFRATDVPAFGYKTYRVADAEETSGKSVGASSLLRAGATTLENEYYTITFDAATGAVSSIFDRELGREWIDAAAKQKFNQLVYVSNKTKTSPDGTTYSPAVGASLTPRLGPVAAEMVATFRDPALGDADVTQTVRLYAGMRRIDVDNDLRHVGMLHSSRSADRYRHNLFYAFPLQVDDFTSRAEYPGGVVRPHVDQLGWGSQDYLAANRWVDVSNARFGITMAVSNTPIVHFGEIRYNRLSDDYRPTSSHLYSFAWSNRMSGLFTLSPADMNNRFRYSFTSHAGDWDAGATTRFGWSIASPLTVRAIPAGQSGALPAGTASFLSVNAPNVQLTVLKASEQPGRGWIVRLVETEGRATDAVLDASAFPINAATQCDLVENDREPLAVADGRVALTLRPFSFATVRLFDRSPAPVEVASLRAEALSDSSVGLSWAAVPGADAYNVYRSVDPAAPPSAHTWVGRATGAGYTDRGLFLDTTYHYRVAAIGAGNQQGKVSAPVVVSTATTNTTPPAPLVDFDIVRETSDRLMICWNRSPAPDIARYFVYRGEDPDFVADEKTLVAVVEPSGYYLDHYADSGLQPGRTYYYQVHPEDWAGNRELRSKVATGSTPEESP